MALLAERADASVVAHDDLRERDPEFLAEQPVLDQLVDRSHDRGSRAGVERLDHLGAAGAARVLPAEPLAPCPGGRGFLDARDRLERPVGRATDRAVVALEQADQARDRMRVAQVPEGL